MHWLFPSAPAPLRGVNVSSPPTAIHRGACTSPILDRLLNLFCPRIASGSMRIYQVLSAMAVVLAKGLTRMKPATPGFSFAN